MSVRYVLTAVLPRYTMRGSHATARPALALVPESEPAQPVAPQLYVVLPEPEGDDARVMGHD